MAAVYGIVGTLTEIALLAAAVFGMLMAAGLF